MKSFTLLSVLIVSLSGSLALAGLPFKSLECWVPKANQRYNNVEALRIYHDQANYRMRVDVKRVNDYWDIFTPWFDVAKECPTDAASYLKGSDGKYLPLINCFRKIRQGDLVVKTTTVADKGITHLPHNKTKSTRTEGGRYEILVMNSATKVLGNDLKIFRFSPNWCVANQ